MAATTTRRPWPRRLTRSLRRRALKRLKAQAAASPAPTPPPEPDTDDGWTNYAPLPEPIDLPIPTSGDGWIVVSKKDGPADDFEVAAVSTDGAHIVDLTANEGAHAIEADDRAAAVSPDGRQIAFTSTRDHEGDGALSWELYVMSSDGSDERRLTAGGQQLGSVRWTPDGKWITYGTLDTSAAAEGEFAVDILAIRPDGSDRHERLRVDGFVLGYDWLPQNESRLMISTCAGFPSMACEIKVLHTVTGQEEQLTGETETGATAGPSWSPDGSQIAFLSTRDENGECYFGDCTGYNGEVYVMNADGSSQRRLTDDAGLESAPSWSPDGTRLVFTRTKRIRKRQHDEWIWSLVTVDVATAVETVLAADDTRILSGPI